eukprot:EG_transcript_37676
MMNATKSLFAKGRLAPVQLEVLRLYRAFLKSIAKKDDPKTREGLRSYVRAEFDQGRQIPRNKFDAIEWKLEYGRLQLSKLDEMKPGVTFSFYQPSSQNK